jgi:hypothetical protein
MLDFILIVALLAGFGSFFLLAKWCDGQVSKKIEVN